jgi:hypothetical protein
MIHDKANLEECLEQREEESRERKTNDSGVSLMESGSGLL